MKRLVAVFILMAMTARAETPPATAPSAPGDLSSTPSEPSAAKEVSVKSDSNDTYNFYFQKAPGPQTVIQGGASSGQTASATGGATTDNPTTGAAAPSTATSVPTAPEVKPRDYYPWSLTLGYANLSDASGHYTGIDVSGAHNFSKFWAIEGGLLIASTNGNGGDPLGGEVRRRGLDIFDLHAGGLVIPVHIKFFDSTVIEWGLGLGLQTLDSSSSSPSYANVGSVAVKKNLVTYVASHFAVNLADELSFISEIRASGTLQAGYAGMRYRF